MRVPLLTIHDHATLLLQSSRLYTFHARPQSRQERDSFDDCEEEDGVTITSMMGVRAALSLRLSFFSFYFTYVLGTSTVLPAFFLSQTSFRSKRSRSTSAKKGRKRKGLKCRYASEKRKKRHERGKLEKSRRELRKEN